MEKQILIKFLHFEIKWDMFQKQKMDDYSENRSFKKVYT